MSRTYALSNDEIYIELANDYLSFGFSPKLNFSQRLDLQQGLDTLLVRAINGMRVVLGRKFTSNARPKKYAF